MATTTQKPLTPEQEQILKNFRRLWDIKKSNEGITQNQAAAELGWTQSAFSHYLVNITVLNRAAIIKLANFFDVPPEDIDPNFNREEAIYRRAEQLCKLSGKPPSTETISFVQSRATPNMKLIEIDMPNDYAPVGTRVACIPTEEARATGKGQITKLNFENNVYCIYRKTAKQKFTIKDFNRDDWQKLNVNNFVEHYTAVWVAVF